MFFPFLSSWPSGSRLCLRCSRLLRTPPSRRNHHQVDVKTPGAADVPQPQQQRVGRALSGLKGLRSRSSVLRPVGPSARTILGQSADVPIRARFAPSPTGYMHLGSLRTALFNNLAARAPKGGAFILRIEDTDQNRLVEDAEERLLSDLRWAGLSWDEGPDRGGPYGPYRQSERIHIYAHHVRQLLDNGHAYRCFCSSEQIESQKRLLHEEGMSTAYAGTCRPIDPEESQRRAESGESFVVRFKGNVHGPIRFRDAVYGLIQKKSDEEDFVILKSDGFPTYHLANVVDDHLMAITHVIRGEEWIISTPKHIALYGAFGWQPPTFAHLGLLVDPDGAKLSKRDDAVSLSKYQDGLIFPGALLSWLANLGSSFKQDIKAPRTVEDMADALTFKFTKGGIRLNFSKLQHFQTRYREALLSAPPSPAEEALIDRHLIQPLLREVDAITEGLTTTNTLPPAWQTLPLDLVPALRPPSSSRTSYVKRIFALTQDRFDCPTRLVQQHPYLFWRVPPHLYRTSAATATAADRQVLDQLRRAIDERWLDVQADDSSSSPISSRPEPSALHVIDAVRQNLHLDNPLIVHEMLRLVGAGDRHVVSHSSACMLALLGRDEWRHRLSAVSDAWSTEPVR
ncbi:hypothetical protein CP532_5087 [Ophiocordyceps camponoti-leonardi (nom. inval.)]|nr:hypothetical protein CP532_5087 [Ophiocordyceps camponoti-leonardi (nom. inval.)]